MRQPLSILLGLALLAIAPGCVHPCCDLERGCRDLNRGCPPDACCDSSQPLCCPRGPDAECHGFKPTTWQAWPCDDNNFAMHDASQSPALAPPPPQAEDLPPTPRAVRREPKLKKTSSARPRVSRGYATKPAGQAGQQHEQVVHQRVAVKRQSTNVVQESQEPANANAWSPKRPLRAKAPVRTAETEMESTADDAETAASEESQESTTDVIFDEAVKPASFEEPSAIPTLPAVEKQQDQTKAPSVAVTPIEAPIQIPARDTKVLPILIFKPVSDQKAGQPTEPQRVFADADESDDLPPAIPAAAAAPMVEEIEDESDDPAPRPFWASPVTHGPATSSPTASSGWKARS